MEPPVIRIVETTIPESELRILGNDFYGHMIKGVVDIAREIIAFGGEYHMDANKILIENGSNQADVWGFNWYFDVPNDKKIEYTSLINIRPLQGNRGMEVKDVTIRERIGAIVRAKIV
jgi:hypothetical protein